MCDTNKIHCFASRRLFLYINFISIRFGSNNEYNSSEQFK